MRTFDLARTHGQILGKSALVIQAIGSMGDIAVASTYRSLGIGGVLRFQGRFKLAHHVLPTILFQPRLLLFPPGLFILRRQGVGRRRKVVAKVVKIDQILALGSKWQLRLVGDPLRSVPQSMNLGLTSRSRRDHALTPLGSRLLDPAGSRGKRRTHRARLMRQAQAGLLPTQWAGFSSIL